MVLTVVLAALGLAALGGVALGLATAGPGRQPDTGRAGQWLRVAALVLAVMVAAALARTAVADSGWFAVVLLGVPVAGAALPVAAGLAGRGVRAATWAGTLVVTGWGLLLGLGPGLWFLVAAVPLAMAATLPFPRRATGTGVP